LASALLFHRARLVHGERLPVDGPVLYLGLHRNGAIDGYVYKALLPRAVFMISVQLRRNPIGRLFFDGIEVSRAKDGGDGDGNSNRDALARCVALLQSGGALFVMPEGSSDLGHTHLPFHKGAARILASALAQGIRPTVVPLGIHYERAWAWQSDVEVVVGQPIDCGLPADVDLPRAVRLLHARIVAALESVAVTAPDGETFSRWERLAYGATLGTGRGYFSALKRLEGGLPDAELAVQELDTRLHGQLLLRHQDVPLVPLRHAWAYGAYALLLAPPVLAACLANLPPLLLARWAGRRFADARNTIALWRLLAGLPALLLWAGGLLAVALADGRPSWWLGYVLVSWLGLRSIYRVKKLAVSLGNLALARGLRQGLATFHGRLDQIFRAGGA
jgi:1-acyl-sn-glycerol-3-phosphate acyltransferase